MEPHVRIAERAHPYYYPRILFLQKRKVVDYRGNGNGHGNGNGNGNGCGGDLKTAMEGLTEPRVRTAERAHPYYYPRILFLQGRKMADYRGNGNGNGRG